MSRVIVTIRGPVALRQLIANRMMMAGLWLRNEHRKNIDRPYPPASVEGEFPARRTGRLRDGILLEVEPARVIVADTTPYWVYLWRRNRLMLGHTYRQGRNQIVKMILKG